MTYIRFTNRIPLLACEVMLVVAVMLPPAAAVLDLVDELPAVTVSQQFDVDSATGVHGELVHVFTRTLQTW